MKPYTNTHASTSPPVDVVPVADAAIARVLKSPYGLAFHLLGANVDAFDPFGLSPPTTRLEVVEYSEQ